MCIRDSSYGTFEDKLYVVGGFWAGLGKGFSTTVIWDGENLHPTLDYRLEQHVFTFLLTSMENPGVAYSIAF